MGNVTKVSSDEIVQVSLGGKEFYKLAMDVKHQKFDIKQEIYSTLINEFILTFILTYENPPQYFELFKAIQTIEFKEKIN